MPTYKITIMMNNAAFEDNGEGYEVSNILSKVALRCRERGHAADLRLQDNNGNYVGEAVRDNE
jgi:hypothetical protein